MAASYSATPLKSEPVSFASAIRTRIALFIRSRWLLLWHAPCGLCAHCARPLHELGGELVCLSCDAEELCQTSR